jgi:hypothetical protein
MKNLSQAYLLDNGFQQKQGDEEYFENVLLGSTGPSMTIFIFTDSACIQIGGSGELKDLKIESEEQLTGLLTTLESVIQ